jgi:hypothetical protein
VSPRLQRIAPRPRSSASALPLAFVALFAAAVLGSACTGNPTVLASWQGNGFGVAVDATSVYWTDGYKVFKMGK